MPLFDVWVDVLYDYDEEDTIKVTVEASGREEAIRKAEKEVGLSYSCRVEHSEAKQLPEPDDEPESMIPTEPDPFDDLPKDENGNIIVLPFYLTEEGLAVEKKADELGQLVRVDGDIVYRNIAELSSMSNNDEVVWYSLVQGITLREVNPPVGRVRRFSFCKPTYSVCRPIFNDEGLDIDFVGRPWPLSELEPKGEPGMTDLTVLLDGYYRLKDNLCFPLNCILRKDPSETIAYIIARNFYDCMSGGIPMGMHYLLRKICDLPEINKATTVYPKRGDGDREDWHTLQDYMDEYDRDKFCDEKFDPFFQRIPRLLPEPDNSLPEVKNG